MAQSQLNSPSSRGKHTPSQDLLEDLDYLSQDKVELYEDGQISDDENASEGKNTSPNNKGKSS